MDNVRIEKLANGLTIITDTVPTIETAFVGVWSSVGSFNESKELNGISHFLEHMAFKGTKTKSYKDIAEIIEDIGGDINAYTSKDHTFYYTKTLKEYLETSIDILSDIIQNSIFDEVEVEKERNVILQELYSSLDTPDDIIYDYFSETAYPNQSMGRPILGSVESIKSITPAQLRDYVNKNYCADRISLVVSGNIDHNKVVELAKKYFTSLVPAGECSVAKSKYKGGYFAKNKDLEQIHFMLGFESSNFQNRRDVFTEGILNTTLGGGMSSRLFQEVREKQNLVYTIYSNNSSYIDTGCLSIYTSTTSEKINQVIDTTTSEILKILNDGITQKELDRAKIGYKSGLLMSLENTRSRARILGSYMQNYKKVIPFSESISLIESIGLEDIKNIAKKIFSSKPTVTYLGNTKGVYDMEKITSLLK